MRSVPFVLSLLLIPFLTPASAAACGGVPKGEEPLIEIAYSAGGEEAGTTVLRLFSLNRADFEGGVLEVELVGLRRHCRRVGGPELDALVEALDGPELARLLGEGSGGSAGAGASGATVLTVARGSARLSGSPGELPGEVLSQVARVEALFQKQLPGLLGESLPFRVREPVR